MSRDTKRVKRRKVLKTGAVVTAGVTGFVGTVGAKGKGKGKGMGGSGFTWDLGLQSLNDFKGDFEYVETHPDEWLLEQAPGCTKGQPKVYEGWIVADTDSNKTTTVYLNPNRNVNTGVPVELKNVIDGCEGFAYKRGNKTNGETKSTNKITFGSA